MRTRNRKVSLIGEVVRQYPRHWQLSLVGLCMVFRGGRRQVSMVDRHPGWQSTSPLAGVVGVRG